MKEIKAYVKPHKLYDVTLALREVAGLSGLSITEVQGFGRGGMHRPHELPEDRSTGFHPYARLEVVCDDDVADTVVETIQRTAHTGLRGDGKIVVAAVERVVRISTGERSGSVS